MWELSVRCPELEFGEIESAVQMRFTTKSPVAVKSWAAEEGSNHVDQ